MTQRVLGPTGSPRRRWTLLLPLIAVLALGALYIAGAQAVNNTGAFELDGNAVSTTGNAGTGADDWDRVCREVVGSDCSTTATTQTADPKSTARTWTDASSSFEIYTGGGSKDFNDPEADWLWKPKDTVPDKDTILHSFAARYSLTPNATTCPSADTTCEVIFFGTDRFDNSGDSQLGFWFFQNKVQTTNTSSGGGFKFSGQHKTGDLLVISDFSNGGTTSTIKVYSWQPTACPKADSGSEDSIQVGGCPAKNLRLEGKSTAANCATSAGTSAFCGIVNASNGETAPWSYTDKSGNSTYLQGEFYEAGLNISALGFGNECFASVLAESRASDSVSAVLKDFVLSNFGECGSSIATTPQTGAGGSIPSGGLSIGASARVDVRDQAVITVTGLGGSFGGSVKFFLCGPLALDSTSNCATGGVQIGTPTTGETVSGSGGTATVNSDTATLTSVGRYCWRAEYSGDSAKGVPASSDPKPTGDTSVTECFKVNPVTPTLTTTAGADVTLGSPISDTASLTGTAKQPGTDGIGPGGTINATAATQAAAGGSITFSVKGPNNCNDSGLTVSGSPVAVSGDNASYGPVTATPTAVGTYTFVATYSGNGPNTNGAGPSGCPEASEEVVVTGTASSASAQRWLPNDRITITGPTNLNGTLTVTLYSGDNCGATSGSAISGQQYSTTFTNATSPQVFNTSNATFFVGTNPDGTAGGAAGSYSWKVHYDDTALNDPADRCEKSTVSITD